MFSLRNTLAMMLAASALTLLSCGGQSQRQTPGTVQAPPGDQDLPPHQAAEVCLATARELENNGFETQAIVQYERARNFNPRLAGVSRRLAVLYDRNGQSAKALNEYQRALIEAPNDAGLLNDFGYFHYVRGNWTDAERYFRSALAIDNSKALYWNNLGMTLAQKGDYDAAYDACAKAIGPAEARANIGMIMAQHGRFDDAARSLQQALALNPDIPQARAVLQWLREQSEQNSQRN